MKPKELFEEARKEINKDPYSHWWMGKCVGLKEMQEACLKEIEECEITKCWIGKEDLEEYPHHKTENGDWFVEQIDKEELKQRIKGK